MAEERAVKDDAEDAATPVRTCGAASTSSTSCWSALSARAACALEIGRQKKRLGLEIYQPSREADVLAHVQQINPGPLNDAAIKRLFERVIDEARRLEREAPRDNRKIELNSERTRPDPGPRVSSDRQEAGSLR